MANWCRGGLVVRGKKDNIKRFLLENLSANDIKIYENNNGLIIRSNERIFIKGTSCDFIGDDIEFNFASEECTMNEFMATNYIKSEQYIQISKQYNIDINVGGVDIYGGFVQEIEIQKGEVIKESVEDIDLSFRAGDEDDNNFFEVIPSQVNGVPLPEDDLPF